MQKRCFKFYLITDPDIPDMMERLELALQGGVDAVQFRANGLPDRLFLEYAKRVGELTSHYGARFLINDRAEIAHCLHADGIHFKSWRLAGGWLDNIEMGFGFSTHSVAEAVAAKQLGADFITAGPVFYTESKKGYGAPIGLDGLKKIVEVGLPVLGLGGIKLENVVDVLRTGACGISMISHILHAEDPLDCSKRVAAAIGLI